MLAGLTDETLLQFLPTLDMNKLQSADFLLEEDEIEEYQFDKKIKIYTLKCGKQVLIELEVIIIVYTTEIIKDSANAINQKKFNSSQKELRPDSYVSCVFDRIGARFTGKTHNFTHHEPPQRKS